MAVSLLLKCRLKFAAADMSYFVATPTNQLGLTYNVNHLLADNLHDIYSLIFLKNKMTQKRSLCCNPQCHFRC